MGLTVATDDPPLKREPPHNWEAEQAILGALLIDNTVYNTVADIVRPEHFADPLHGRIYEAISSLIDRNQVANPITLKPFFDGEDALRKAGGAGYFARLAGSAIGVIDAKDFADQVRDLYRRRRLIEYAEGVILAASAPAADIPAASLMELAEADLHAIDGDGKQQANAVSSIGDAAKRALAGYEEAHKRRRPKGIGTGLATLDRVLGGMDAGDLVILAGRPSIGKSSCALGIAMANAGRFMREAGDAPPKLVVYFSLEERSDTVGGVILGWSSGVSSYRADRGELNGHEIARLIEAGQSIPDDFPLWIDERPQATPAMIRATLRRLAMRQPIGLVIVDHLHLMRPDRPRRDGSRVNEIADLSAAMKGVAKTFDAPVILAAQLSRAVEQRDDKRPVLSDLRDSGTLEQDADTVLFLYREEYYLAREGEPTDPEQAVVWRDRSAAAAGRAQIIIAKQRRGPVNVANVGFDGSLRRFYDVQDHASHGAARVDLDG
jgi:replicative DNA helicase